MEAAIKRILPHSTEAEQAVVGAMLMDKDAIMVAAEMLTGEDFYQSAYGMLFDAMVELFQAGKPVDLITLQEHLKEKMLRRRSADWSLQENFWSTPRPRQISSIMQRSSAKKQLFGR